MGFCSLSWGGVEARSSIVGGIGGRNGAVVVGVRLCLSVWRSWVLESGDDVKGLRVRPGDVLV